MQGQEYPQTMERTMRIKRIDPLSYGKIQGGVGVLVGLIAGALFALMSVIGLGAAGRQGGILGIVFGIGAIIFVPLFYGIAGFIGGLILALIYNLIANFAGGLEITVE